jgi:hypothetical protein
MFAVCGRRRRNRKAGGSARRFKVNGAGRTFGTKWMFQMSHKRLQMPEMVLDLTPPSQQEGIQDQVCVQNESCDNGNGRRNGEKFPDLRLATASFGSLTIRAITICMPK